MISHRRFPVPVRAFVVTLLLVAAVFASNRICAQESSVPDKFTPTPESLKQYSTPEWFRDAKFGIFMHWGGQSVDGMDSWYARRMYKQGSDAYKYHVKQFGHPSEVGYKDVLKTWKANKFDAHRLVRLVKQAGAKYFTPCAVHHDNFDLWDSTHHRWNATEVGPKQDLIGQLHQATKKHGLRWGVTTHLARSYSWLQTSHGSDDHGPKKGVPYDGQNKKFWDLYHPPSDDWNLEHPKNPPKSWRKEWKMRLKDLIRNYDPDLLYFDSAIPFEGEGHGQTGMDVISYYYNTNIDRNGEFEAVMNTKTYDPPDHGREIPGTATIDIEKGRFNDIRSQPWQTDASVGPWYWERNADYRSTRAIVHELVDIVSKRGNLLLNIPPRPGGQLDPQVVDLLKSIGNWLEVNGEAIYGTRPWAVYGEGPSVRNQRNLNRQAKEPDITYSARDVRYTRSKEGHTVYAILMGWPDASSFTLNAMQVQGAKQNARVSLLGHDGKLGYRTNPNDRMVVEIPDRKPGKYAFVLKFQGFDLSAVDSASSPLTNKRPVRASSVYKGQVNRHGPAKAVDGKWNTRWATDAEVHDPWITIDLEKSRTISRIVINESHGKRIQSHSLEYRNTSNGEWKTIYRGKTVGATYERTFEPVNARYIRLNIHDATKGPTISELMLFGSK